MGKIIQFNIYTKWLAFLLVFHFVVNLVWFLLNTSPLPWDQAGHTRMAMEFAKFFTSVRAIHILDVFTLSNYYPPLLYLIATIPIIIFGHVIFVTSIIITIFYLVSIVLMYMYTSDITKKQLAGVIAAYIYSFLPIVVEHSHWFLLEIPMLTFLLAALICLHRSVNFTIPKYTYWFFIFAALAMVTKWLVIVYLTIPILFAVYNWLKMPHEVKKTAYSAFENGIFIFAVIFLPWYVINAQTFFPQIAPNLQGESSDPQNLTSITDWVFYLYEFVNFQTTVYIAIVFFAAAYFYYKKKAPQRFLFFGSMICIYLFFTFVGNKDWRYTMPLVIFASAIIGWFFAKLLQRKKTLGTIVISTIFAYQFILFMVLSFRTATHLTTQHAIDFPVIGWIDYINFNDNLIRSYHNENWHQQEILSFVSQQQTVNATKWMLVDVDQERFNDGNMLLTRDILGITNVEADTPPQHLLTDSGMTAFLNKYDFAVIAVTHPTVAATRNAAVYEQIKTVIETDRRNQVVKSFFLPSGDQILLYKLYHQTQLQ